jgi:hypothetical protein
MGIASFRKMASCVLLTAFPVSLSAADPSAAMLYTHGAAWLNGSHVPASSAIFDGDLLQTRSDSGADINAPGSSITVLGDSLVQFGGSSLKVQHGEVSVATSKSVATTAGDVHVSPASNAWTEFNVSDVNGTVKIEARKGDLIVRDEDGTVTLPQGQTTTRDDQSTPSSGSTDASGKPDKKSKTQKQNDGAQPAAHGGALGSTIAIASGAAVIGAVSIWVLTKSNNPISPSGPN